MAQQEAAPIRAEEIASTAVQAVGTLLSVAALVVVVMAAIDTGKTVAVVCAAVYGAAMILSFLASTLYHGAFNHPTLSRSAVKRALRTVDHCAIYLLIAGTYTPLAMLVLPHDEGWILTLIIWVIAFAGVALRIAAPHSLLKLRVGLYLLMGWLVIAWANSLMAGLGTTGSVMLLLGGLTYTAGIAVYLRRSLPYREAIWHGFVIAGTACFFVVIAFFALPAGGLAGG